MNVRGVFPTAVCCLLAAAALFAGSRPPTVSPGATSKLVLIEGRCPTFSWGQVGGARRYELVVYRFGEQGEAAEPLLRQTFRGSISSWTPSLSNCLERGGRYAWSVRAVGHKGPSGWSSPSLFQVASGPSGDELEAALQVAGGYLNAGRGSMSSSRVAAETEAGSEADVGREASKPSPPPQAAAATQLSVDGGIEAASFRGDGSELTGLDPTSLTAGEAEIDISGTAATAANAGNADTVDGEHAAALEESLEIDEDITAHADIAFAHHPEITLETITPTTTKGDLLVDDGAVLVALAVGTDGQVLEAHSTAPTGLKWTDEGLPWVDVTKHGAKGDGVTDDTLPIEAAMQAAAALDHGRVLFPPAVAYVTTNTITVPVGVEMWMQAPIRFKGDDQTAAIVIGEEDVPNGDLHHVLRVEKQPISSWSNEGSVGIVLHNANTSHIEVKRVEGFTIGLQCVGSGGLFGYNQVYLGRIFNNKIGLDLTNYDPGTGIGACNENVFVNGRFGANSGVRSGVSRYGVRITSMDGSYTNNNNNLFLKPSFELGASGASPGEAVPVLLEHGFSNRFESCRHEGNSPTFARVLNDATANVFDLGYGGVPLVEDLSSHPASLATGRDSDIARRPGTLVFHSGPVAQHAGPYDSAKIHIPRVHMAASSDSAVYPALNLITVTAEYLGVPGPRGVAVFLDTTRKKRFVVRRDADLDDQGTADPADDIDYGGRLLVRCYDEDDLVIGGPSVDLVTGTGSTSPFWNASFGGSYKQGADGSRDRYFRVDDSVKKVALILAGGTNELRLKSFSVYSVDGGDARVWAGYEEGIAGSNVGTEIPTTGTWEEGRIVYNHDPDSGEAVGWVCVQSGSPGVWKSMGTIGP